MEPDFEKEVEQHYVKAGKICTAVRKTARKIVKPGAKLLDIAETIEKEILELGGGAAWPVNLSANHIAAHYAPSVDDKTIVGEKDVMKVDIGVHVDGYIADSSMTIDCANEWGKMVEAAKEALDNAVSVAKPGVPLNKLSEEIEKAITKRGFKPVENLSGHGLEQYITHAPPRVANVSHPDTRVLEPGMAIAIEPFATNGRGSVRDSVQAEIFSLNEVRAVRDLNARKILDWIQTNRKTLPFGERWIANELKLTELQRKIAFRELLQKGCLESYPPLVEQANSIVTQFETSLLIKENSVIVLVE